MTQTKCFYVNILLLWVNMNIIIGIPNIIFKFNNADLLCTGIAVHRKTAVGYSEHMHPLSRIATLWCVASLNVISTAACDVCVYNLRLLHAKRGVVGVAVLACKKMCTMKQSTCKCSARNNYLACK